jgi:ABC-type antimicrobial peptide transport system permease subunit
MALGSSARGVTRLVVGQGMRLALAGLAVGLAAALAAARLLGSVLYGIGSTDPATLAGVGAVLTAVAFTASWLPARRASRVDPLEALRRE